LLITIAAAVASLCVWAALAEIDTVAQANGKAIPSARIQHVSSLDGGTVAAIEVQQGQRVAAGAPLLVLSPVAAQGDLQTRRQQQLALQARSARLKAEAEGGEPVFPAGLDKDGTDYGRIEQAAFVTRRAEQQSQLAALSAQIAQRQQELEEARVALSTAQRMLTSARAEREIIEKLVTQGLEPKLELLRLDRAINDAEGREGAAKAGIERLQQAIVETRARRDASQQAFRAQAREEASRANADLRALEQGLPALAERADRTLLKSPVAGTVNRVLLTTVGSAARAGEPLVEIVPDDDQLVFEAFVLPKDIGFVHPGQTARVRVSAFDYSIYGALEGKVTQVGADAVGNERGEFFYLVRIETAAKAIVNRGQTLPIQPGMQAQIDIVTGSKTVANYLLKPLIAVRENAFGER
jgi:adhesin transport system membrane fusion protein